MIPFWSSTIIMYPVYLLHVEGAFDTVYKQHSNEYVPEPLK